MELKVKIDIEIGEGTRLWAEALMGALASAAAQKAPVLVATDQAAAQKAPVLVAADQAAAQKAPVPDQVPEQVADIPDQPVSLLVREIKELLERETPTSEQLVAFEADTRPSVRRLLAEWKEKQRLAALAPPAPAAPVEQDEADAAWIPPVPGPATPVEPDEAEGLEVCTRLGGQLFASLGPEAGGKALLDILWQCHQPVTLPDRPKILTLNAEAQARFRAEVSSRLGIRPGSAAPASPEVSPDAPY